MLYMMLFIRNLAGGTDKKPEDQASNGAEKKLAGNKRSHTSERDEQVVALMAAVF